jgi:hypothetical protein
VALPVGGADNDNDEETQRVDDPVEPEAPEPSIAETDGLETVVQDAGQLERAGVDENNLLMARAQLLQE